MVYQVCIINQNRAIHSNSYPYTDTVLIRDRISRVYRFPEQDGEPEDDKSGFRKISPELEKALSSITSDHSPEFVENITTLGGMKIMILQVSDSTPSVTSDVPQLLESDQNIIRVLMDEVRQGRVCHSKIHSNVREIFFGDDSIPPSSPYFYEPASHLHPTKYALIATPGDTPESIIHSPGYYRIPMIGYHGLSETFVPRVFSEGLKSTKRDGMYGNDAYYFGSFYKAIRYSFRDSSFSTMKQKTPLYKSSRPSGYLEVPNTAHINPSTGDIETDLIRDSPALIRFVLFSKNTSFLPQELSKSTGKSVVLKSLSSKLSNNFVNYRKNTDGDSKTVYTIDYLNTQVNVPLFNGGYGDYPKGDDDDLEVSEDSTREDVALRLYRAIHVATRPAFV